MEAPDKKKSLKRSLLFAEEEVDLPVTPTPNKKVSNGQYKKPVIPIGKTKDPNFQGTLTAARRVGSFQLKVFFGLIPVWKGTPFV